MCMCENENKKAETSEVVAEPAEEAVQDTEEVVAEPVEEGADPAEEQPVEESEAGKAEGFLKASECAEEILKARESELEEIFQSVRNTLLRAVEQARVNGMDARDLAQMKEEIPAMSKTEVPPVIRREMAEAGWEILDVNGNLLVRPSDKAIYQLQRELEDRYKK